MKTRNGFVSNSSSSSFVIGLPKRPKTWEELHVTLFGDMIDREFHPSWLKITEKAHNTVFSTSHEIAKNIFNQIEDQDSVQDSILARICDPDSYPKLPFWDDIKKGRLLKRMKNRYAIEYPYCISPTNRFWKQIQKINNRVRANYDTKVAKLRKAKWAKIAPKFKGLKKFVIMTQTDGGPNSKILLIMEDCWNEIVKKVKSVKLTGH